MLCCIGCNHTRFLLYFPGIHGCLPVIHLLHLITTRTYVAPASKLMAAAELRISATRFDSLNIQYIQHQYGLKERRASGPPFCSLWLSSGADFSVQATVSRPPLKRHLTCVQQADSA